MQLKGMEVVAKQSSAAQAEDRKDARVDQQDTNESKKIAQRQNNTPPIDFKKKFENIFNTSNNQPQNV
jgi:hypothetical protein